MVLPLQFFHQLEDLDNKVCILHRRPRASFPARREDGKGLPGWQEALFAFMERNAAHLTDFFNLPGDQVVEIGRQISI